jgi:hypothetical protein
MFSAQRTDDRTGAGAGHQIDLDIARLERLDHADMCEAASGAAA